MSNIKFSPNLFLETIELQRFKEFFDIEQIDSSTGFSSIGGFRKNILENSVSFGLIKNDRDINFKNGWVQPDIDVIEGSTTIKTIKINDLYAVDSFGQFIYQAKESSIQISSSNNWYWVRISHQFSNQEKGTFSLSPDGTLTGTGGELTKVLRGGQTNFASKIRLLNSTLNTLDYEVLEVIDDNNCILQGTSFQSETNLNFGIVGTFTPGVSIPSDNQMIFQYDSCLLELVLETSTNTPPTSGFVSGQTFYIARVKSDGTTLIVQDKRKDFWETKGSDLSIDIDRDLNSLIGVESVKYENQLTPGDQNIISISWGLRGDNWNIDTNTNTLTLLGTVVGGIYRTIVSIPDNTFDGWRVYTSNGKYSRVLTSTKSGSALNLSLDVLDIDNYFTGGTGDPVNKIEQTLLIVPNVEEVEILLSPDPTASLSSETKSYTFSVNTQVGNCPVLAYDSVESGLYNIKYRYKSFKEYTDFITIPSSGEVGGGYYNESQFDSDGNLIVSPSLSTYTSDDTDGFIPVNLSPKAYSRFVNKVDKGDLIGITEISTFTTSTYDLIVGTNLNFLKITGSITLTSDQTIRLNTSNTINGNEFRIQIDCDDFNLNGHEFKLVQGNGVLNTDLKSITQGDLYMMKNQDGGIVLDCVYDGSSWSYYQNYDLGRPNEVIDLYNVTVSSLFDLTTKMGKVKGLFGYVISDGTSGSPNLSGKFIVGYSATDGDYSTPGDTGGEKKHTLTESELPVIDLNRTNQGLMFTDGTLTVDGTDSTPGEPNLESFASIPTFGGGQSHENRPPYFTLIKAYKLF